MASPQTNGNGNQDADTYGWDTVFALNFTHANAAVVAGWPNVGNAAKNMSQSADGAAGYNIQATLGPWQLYTGGDGKNVRLSCPITAGTYTTPTKSYPLAGANVQVIIEIGMEWVPDPSQFFFTIEGNSAVGAIVTDLGNGQIDAALRTAFSNNKKPLGSGATVATQIAGKNWLITDGAAQYYIFLTSDKDNEKYLFVYQFAAVWTVNLKAIQDAVNKDLPAVALIQIVNNPTSGGVAGAVLAQMLSSWFNANIGAYNQVFAAVNLSPVVAKQTNYTWMLPTATSYAVSGQGTLDSSVFGVLTMVQNNAPGANHQVSPYVLPKGADAGFLISGANFMKNMMLAGAQLIFSNAPASNFTISNDKLTIVNNTRILFGTFHMDDNPKGSVDDNGYSTQLDAGTLSSGLINALTTIGVDVASGYRVKITDAGSQWVLATGDVQTNEYILDKNGAKLDVYRATSLYVDANNFQMGLNHTWVQIQFINVTYPANDDWDTHVNYTENVPLSLKNEAGKNIFWMGDPTSRNLVVSVTQTKAAITRQIVEDAVFGVLALVAIAGPIIEGLAAGSEIGVISEDGAEAVVNESTFARVEQENPGLVAEENEESGLLASRQSGGRCTNIKAAFKTTKWKVVGVLALAAGAVRGADELVDQILKSAALKKWDGVPGFDDFAQTVIKPYSWQNISGFTLQSAGLAGSLQIGLKVKTGS